MLRSYFIRKMGSAKVLFHLSCLTFLLGIPIFGFSQEHTKEEILSYIEKNNKSFGDFKSLIPKLANAVPDPYKMVDVFASGTFKVNIRLVQINATHREKSSQYQSGTRKKDIEKGRIFLKKNQAILEKALREWRVSPEIVTSILWYETRFGTKTGTYPVVEAYATLQLMSNQKGLKDMQKRLRKSGDKKTNLLEKKTAKRLIKRANGLARDNLIAIFEIAHRHAIDPLEIKGSWAGAIGYPQFIPTSFRDLAIDGDENGKIDLYSWPDAIFSICSHLVQKGKWDISSMDRMRAALYDYNNSDPYVNGVLEYAQKLRTTQ